MGKKDGKQAKDPGPNALVEDLQESGGPRAQEYLPQFPDWAETAWRLYCRGQRNLTALAKTLGVRDYRTVKAVIRKFGDLVRTAGSVSNVEAWQEAITGQEEVLGTAWAIISDDLASPRDRVAALKVASDALGQIAVLNGVLNNRMTLSLNVAEGAAGANGAPSQEEWCLGLIRRGEKPPEAPTGGEGLP